MKGLLTEKLTETRQGRMIEALEGDAQKNQAKTIKSLNLKTAKQIRRNIAGANRG